MRQTLLVSPLLQNVKRSIGQEKHLTTIDRLRKPPRLFLIIISPMSTAVPEKQDLSLRLFPARFYAIIQKSVPRGQVLKRFFFPSIRYG
jgi:hypothetical protein